MKTPGVHLYAPKEYGCQPCSFFEADSRMVERHANGCGSKYSEKFVPDSLLFLSIYEACQIHDWMYSFGVTIEDKIFSDRVFLNNMVRTIKAKKSFKITEKIRLWLAKKYYYTVKNFGGMSFWRGKNFPGEFQKYDNKNYVRKI